MTTKETPSYSAEGTWTEDSFVAPPLIPASRIYAFGAFLFVLAYVWPPLLLLVTLAAARFIPYAFRINDDASTRRQMLRDFELNDKETAYLREIPEGVKSERSYWENNRGLLQCTMTMTPEEVPISAVAFYCHGYGDNPTYTKMNQLSRLVKKGIAVVLIEYEGFGHSDGSLGLVVDFEGQLCADVAQYYEETYKAKFMGKPAFLIGESMGGAVAFCVYNRLPDLFSGVIFLCPMCAIAPEMLPPQWLIDFSKSITGPTGTSNVIGELPIAPSRGDLRLLSFKIPEKRVLWTRHRAMFGRNPRLTTGREMINVTKRISGSLSEFQAPFLVQHGKADRVTDPKLSRMLYDNAKSKDKTILLYEGVWHTLINGETDENIDMVLNDTIKWILERCSKKGE